MFEGFTNRTFEFLYDIRFNNNKEWFEAHKEIYINDIYNPLKELAEELYVLFHDKDMICKVSRIYRDAYFPPHLHYRDKLWISFRTPSKWWSRTPTVYFELSAEGAKFGFGLPKPEAAFMEYFRQKISENPEEFLKAANRVKNFGIPIIGEEYKRPKKCENPELEEYFRKKSIDASVSLEVDGFMFDPDALEDVVCHVFFIVGPFSEYFTNLFVEFEKQKENEKENETPEETSNKYSETIKAPDVDFMW